MVLCQFSFENFKSFKDEATLSLFAENISGHTESLIVDPIDKQKFLPVVSIYGPNGGGKSSVLEALNYLSNQILRPVVSLKALSAEQQENLEKVKIQELESSGNGEKGKHYLFDEHHCELPTKFEILFRSGDSEYKYQLSMLHFDIIEENLYVRDIKSDSMGIVFERNAEDQYLGEVLGGLTIGNIKSSIPLLAHLSINYDNKIIDSVVSWFLNCRVLNYDNPYRDSRVVFLKNKHYEELLLKMLEEMDINIVGVRTEKDSEGKIAAVFTKHKLEDGSCFELPFEEESSGTRKLFGLLPYLLTCLEKGSLVIADEMDAKLHPKLLRYIIGLFTNTAANKGGSQLIFTSHDMSTMNNSVFRRDEIWFSAMGKGSASKLYSLVDFRKENGAKTRADESFDKQYIEGRYGADPYLKTILDWENLK